MRASSSTMRSAAAVLAGFSMVFGCAGVSLDGQSANGLGADLSGAVHDEAAVSADGAERRGETSDLLYQLLVGELAGQFGDLESSVQHYLKAARLSSDPEVAARATRVALYAKERASALEAAMRWVELAPKTVESQQALALLYVRAGKPDSALKHFERILELARQDGNDGYTAIAQALSRQSDPDAALAAFQLLVDEHPDVAQAQYARANLALSAERYALAAKAGARALALNPDLVEARVVRARALMRLDKNDEALDEMASAVESSPGNLKMRRAYARMLVQAEDYDRARDQYTRLLKANPDDAELLQTLGLIDLQQERYEAAAKTFKRLADTSEGADEGHFYLGRVAEERERYQEALDRYGKVGEGQFYIDAQTRIAAMYAETGRLERGREHLEQLRDKASDLDTIVRLYLAEGQVLSEAGKYQAGMDMYNNALTEYPENTDLLYGRALMAEKLGRIDQLETDLQAILEREPDNATALNALGFTLADRKQRMQEALGYIKRAFKARPDDPAVVDSMGWVNFRLGNYAKAEKFLQRAFGMLKDGEIAGHLSEVMWARGEKDRAREILQKALEREPDHEYLRELEKRYSE